MPHSPHRSIPSLLLAALAGALVVSGPVFASAPSPPLNHTGAPGHFSCLSCHGNPAGGTVNFDFGGGLGEYTPGQTYAIEITISEPGQQRWGFAMVARDADAPTVDVGTFSAGSADTGTQLREVTHRNAPFSANSHTFEVNWQAPATGVGDVTFYLAANAANGNNFPDSGDHIYLRNFTITEPVAMNEPPVLSVPDVILSATTGSPRAVPGISIDDPDAADGSLTATLSVQNGILTIADAVAGGVSGGNIGNNGTATVTLEGTLAELNATFGDPGGVVYRSDPGFTGSETLEVMVNDNGNTGPGGEQTDSAEIMIEVNPLPELTDFSFVEAGVFQFTLTGTPGLTYVVETSENLEMWELLEETTLVTDTATVTDDEADVPAKFYRARDSGP